MSTPSLVSYPPSNYKAQENQVDGIRAHWIFERKGHRPGHLHFCWRPFMHFLHHLLCAIAFGHGSMQQVWNVSHPDCSDKVWEHGRDSLRQRLEHVNLVAGLLFTAVTAFCTTDPPENSRILPYTKTGPYIVLLVSIGLSLGGLIVGSATVFVIHKAKVPWFNEIMMGTQLRIWGTMILLSFPFLSVGASTCTAAAGLLIAASQSELALVRGACYALVLPPVSCALIFGWMLCVRTGTEDAVCKNCTWNQEG